MYERVMFHVKHKRDYNTIDFHSNNMCRHLLRERIVSAMT